MTATVFRPNEDGNSVNWSRQPLSLFHWQNVDDAIADDDLTYNYTRAINSLEEFGFPNSSVYADNNSMITYVIFYARGKATGSGATPIANLDFGVRNGKTGTRYAYTSSAKKFTSIYSTHTFLYSLCPWTNQQWTGTDVDNAYFSLQISSYGAFGDNARLTQVYLYVIYYPNTRAGFHVSYTP